jgi:hypothetical protein
MTINRNQILLVLGFLATQGPNLEAVAKWLAGSGIPHVNGAVTLLGWLVTAIGGLALAWPRIRSILAAGGLATPPGAVAPWNPSRDAGPAAPVAPPVGLPGVFVGGPSDRKGSGYDKGSVNPLVLLVAFAVAVLGIILVSRCARADEPAPQFGGCLTSQLCLGPSAAITIGEFNLATSKFSGGVLPGVGYGATFTPASAPWAATGLALYFSFKAGQDGPNQAVPSLMLSFANYVRVGAGVAITETSGPVQTQWQLLFGLGSDFGGSPKYVQASSRNARLSGEADGLMRARVEKAAP